MASSRHRKPVGLPGWLHTELDTIDFGPMSQGLAARCASALRRLTGYDAAVTPLLHSNPERARRLCAS